MPELEPAEEKPQFTPSISPEEELAGLREGKLPNNDRTYLMAHAANAEIDKTEGAIDPQAAAEGAGQLYDRRLTDREYDYILKEGLTEEQRGNLAHAIHPEGEAEKYFDTMTGLSNRNAFENARERADADPGIEVTEFDLNDLKGKNAPGHSAGDEYIREAARALTTAGMDFGINARSIFRVGGDEFVVLIPAGKAEAFQKRAHELFDDYMSAAGQTYQEADEKLMAMKNARGEGKSPEEDAQPYEFKEI